MVAFLHVAAARLSGFPGALLAFFAPLECVGWPLRCGFGFFRTSRRCSELCRARLDWRVCHTLDLQCITKRLKPVGAEKRLDWLGPFPKHQIFSHSQIPMSQSFAVHCSRAAQRPMCEKRQNRTSQRGDEVSISGALFVISTFGN